MRHVLEDGTSRWAAHWPDLIRQVFDEHPRAMIHRTQDPQGFTLVHGDRGCANILVPRAGSRPIYLIDRQPFDWSLTSWLGVHDLVYAAVLDWPVADRRRLEQPLLRRYHDQLLARGVVDYSYDQLWTDYRSTIPIGVYIAVEYGRGGLNGPGRPVWSRYLRRTLTACDDLACTTIW